MVFSCNFERFAIKLLNLALISFKKVKVFDRLSFHSTHMFARGRVCALFLGPRYSRSAVVVDCDKHPSRFFGAIRPKMKNYLKFVSLHEDYSTSFKLLQKLVVVGLSYESSTFSAIATYLY